MGQSHSGTSTPRSSGELSQKQKDDLSQARSRVATEIWESEKVYVRRLEGLIKIYKRPLQRSLTEKHPLITAEAIEAIFSNVEEILTFQEKMVYELEGRLNKWDAKSGIADVFIDNADGLKLYVTYINNYDNALVTIRNHSKSNPKFKAFLKESVLREDSENQDIHSLLITVVQRPPRYCLLIKEMIKHTPDSHKDKKPLMTALEAVEQAAEHINTQKMIAEGHAQGLKVRSAFQNKFAFPPQVSPKIIFDGELKAVKRGKLRIVVFENYFLAGEEKTNLFGHGKSKFDPLVWCPLESIALVPSGETLLTATILPNDVVIAPAEASSSSSPKTPHKDSNPPPLAAATPPAVVRKDGIPTLITTLDNFTLTWENTESMRAWHTTITDAQTAIKKEQEAKNKPSGGFLSFFRW